MNEGQLLLDDRVQLTNTMVNLSRALCAIAAASATAAVAREIHEHGEPVLDAGGRPVTHS